GARLARLPHPAGHRRGHALPDARGRALRLLPRRCGAAARRGRPGGVPPCEQRALRQPPARQPGVDAVPGIAARPRRAGRPGAPGLTGPAAGPPLRPPGRSGPRSDAGARAGQGAAVTTRTPSPISTVPETASIHLRTAGRAKTSRTSATTHTTKTNQARSISVHSTARASRDGRTGAPAGTNCGRKETANTAALGLATLVTTPSRNADHRVGVGRGASAPSAGAAPPPRRAASSDWTPSQISTAAPPNRSTS